MSGIKRSAFEIQRERAAKLKLAGEANNLRGELTGMVGQVKRTIEGASEGLRTTFKEPVQRAEGFIRKTTIPQDKWDADTQTPLLNTAKQSLGRSVAEATSVHKDLTTAFGEKADKLGRELTAQLAEVERVFSGRKELLALWMPDAQLNAWDQALADNRQRLDKQQYSTIGPALQGLLAEMQSRIQFAETQEEKHQQRLYVMNAINKVCTQRGFQRIADPQFDDKNDRGSRIAMMFDTMAKGKIEFSLTLDGIHADSQISGSSCFEDFDALSASLSKMFAIKTEFRGPDGWRPIRKGLIGYGTEQSETITQEQGMANGEA